ncbi:hypothetical protein [Niabella ginsengisoli]|uniref:HEAT repeat domain-containing protein n=1 Tax=Niabella ginsengisoli TaxID=522298 RepID=A0ABS9SLG5_9BACT|nr:hypothetical protein [Niabella ginsengisoli]MCH5598999.1 hypothetical protein [Niabella ginsengisoli]
MNILSILEKPYTKEQANEIVNWVGDNQKHFDTLLNMFLNSDRIIVQRASWPLSYCVANHPDLINKHYKKLITQLNADNKPAAVRRNILRAFDQLPHLPEVHHGVIMDACFRFIEDPNEAIASQAFALGILAKLAKVYPEIKPELDAIIRIRMINAAPAFKSRAKKF